MQRMILSFLVLCGAGFTATAQEKLPYLRVGTQVYTNVTVTAVTATDIVFMHAGGSGNAKLQSLDPQIQKQFGFDPAKSAATEKRPANSAAKTSATPSKPPVRPPAPEATTSAEADDTYIQVPRLSAKSFRGKPAPKFVVEKWLTLAPDTKGKFVLVDFWATWCGPCRASIPELNRFHAKFKDRMVIIGLSDEREAEVRKMRSPKMDYAVAIDPKGRMSKETGVQGIPHALLIDPKGIVRFEGHPGYLTMAGLEKLLARYAQK